MKTRLEMRTKLQRDIMASTASTAFSPTVLDSELDDAYSWARGLYYWEDLSDAKKTSTKANADYYNYPGSWKLGSITSLFVDGLEYDRRNWEDFYKYRLLHPTNDEVVRYFANHNRWFFIFPTPTELGVNNIVVIGNKQGDDMDAGDGAQTIFSQKYEEANEGIVRKAFSSCIKRADQALSKSEEVAALAILTTVRKKELDGKIKDTPLDKPMIEYTQFF